MERLWLRLGDQGDYESFGSDLKAAAEQIQACTNKIEKDDVAWLVQYGIEVSPSFTGHNYVSIYWGDKDAQPTRPLTEQEKQTFTQYLTTY